MTTKVSNLAEDLDQILKSFASMIEGVYFVDEELAESLAAKFSEELRLEVRKVYAAMAKEVAVSLAKPPTKKRRRKKKVEEVVSVKKGEEGIEEGVEMNVGVEELDENPGSLLQQVQDEASVQSTLDNALSSQSVTARSGRRTPDTTKWDTENPTMRPMRPDAE
jgi:hypothetical protein